jgi:hypothetical protein
VNSSYFSPPTLSARIINATAYVINYTFNTSNYSNLFNFFDVTDQAYVYSTPYGIVGSHSYTASGLKNGHVYQATVWYFDANNVWSKSYVVFKIQTSKFKTVSSNISWVAWIQEGVAFAPVTVLAKATVNLANKYSAYGSNLQNVSFSQYSDHTKLPPYIDNELQIDMVQITQGHIWNIHAGGSWVPNYMNYSLSLSNDYMVDTSKVQLYREGSPITLNSGLAPYFTAHGYAYYGSTNYYLGDGFNNYGIKTVYPGDPYTYVGYFMYN